MKSKPELPLRKVEAYERFKEIERVGQEAVRRAQEENRQRGIPNVYCIDGQILFEQPDGTLTPDDPWHGQNHPPSNKKQN